MSLSWLIILGAMLLAAGLPFLFYGMVKIMQGVSQTRTDLKDQTSSMQQSLDTQSGNVQEMLSSQERLIERIQHLEAIVTSEAWDTMAKEKQERIAGELLKFDANELPTDDPSGGELSDGERTASMARNLERE
ncbi:MAG: hypothetical protein OXT73_03560 [Bacteroidota bacterium]|nr:hypothetical protein [Bacteroidota bacterium]